MKTEECKKTKGFSLEEKRAFAQKLRDEDYFQQAVYEVELSDGRHVLTNCATFAQFMDGIF